MVFFSRESFRSSTPESVLMVRSAQSNPELELIGSSTQKNFDFLDEPSAFCRPISVSPSDIHSTKPTTLDKPEQAVRGKQKKRSGVLAIESSFETEYLALQKAEHQKRMKHMDEIHHTRMEILQMEKKIAESKLAQFTPHEPNQSQNQSNMNETNPSCTITSYYSPDDWSIGPTYHNM